MWPESIPDYLALVGDSADGIPGIPRWGAKSTALVLKRYGVLEEIPDRIEDWDIQVRGGSALAQNLAGARPQAALYKELATLRLDVPIRESLPELQWRGARREELEKLSAEIGMSNVVERVGRFREE